MTASELLPAAAAFDAIADRFDARFEPWLSVQAQRRAVRQALLKAFAPGAHVLEVGGGTGLDAAWLRGQQRSVLMTDASAAMVAQARRKLGEQGAETVAAEHLDQLAVRGPLFDGAFSNFAALNCVSDLTPVAQGLAQLVRPGGQVLLVVFGWCSPGEMLTELVRGRFRNIFRRFAPGDVLAQLSGREFTVRYHRGSDMRRAFAPWFRPAGAKAIGLFVPPSAAEPWISRHPRLLAGLEALDRIATNPLAMLGDHILYRFERTDDAA